MVDNVVVLPADTSLGVGRVAIKCPLRSWPSGQGPGAVAAGEAGVDEGA